MERKSVIPPSPAINQPATALEKVQLANADLRKAFNFIVREALSPVALGLGVLYLIFAISHPLVLPPPVAMPLWVAALTTATLLLLIRYFLSRSLPA